jgi:hypothetical protein
MALRERSVGSENIRVSLAFRSVLSLIFSVSTRGTASRALLHGERELLYAFLLEIENGASSVALASAPALARVVASRRLPRASGERNVASSHLADTCPLFPGFPVLVRALSRDAARSHRVSRPPREMKVIFLDVDGVLATRRCVPRLDPVASSRGFDVEMRSSLFRHFVSIHRTRRFVSLASPRRVEDGPS